MQSGSYSNKYKTYSEQLALFIMFNQQLSIKGFWKPIYINGRWDANLYPMLQDKDYLCPFNAPGSEPLFFCSVL